MNNRRQCTVFLKLVLKVINRLDIANNFYFGVNTEKLKTTYNLIEKKINK